LVETNAGAPVGHGIEPTNILFTRH